MLLCLPLELYNLHKSRSSMPPKPKQFPWAIQSGNRMVIEKRFEYRSDAEGEHTKTFFLYVYGGYFQLQTCLV